MISTYGLAANVTVRCPDGRNLDVLPHLVEGHCANQAVFYGAWEQIGTGLLDKHTYDVAPGAVVGRCAPPNSVHVCCVERDVCVVVVEVFREL
jgi:hypothetical protein